MNKRNSIFLMLQAFCLFRLQSDPLLDLLRCNNDLQNLVRAETFLKFAVGSVNRSVIWIPVSYNSSKGITVADVRRGILRETGKAIEDQENIYLIRHKGYPKEMVYKWGYDKGDDPVSEDEIVYPSKIISGMIIDKGPYEDDVKRFMFQMPRMEGFGQYIVLDIPFKSKSETVTVKDIKNSIKNIFNIGSIDQITLWWEDDPLTDNSPSAKLKMKRNFVSLDPYFPRYLFGGAILLNKGA